MHTLGDLFVPFSMEQIYRTRADAQGASQMLVQRAYRDIGHCAFNVVEEEESFAALVNWAENGVRPAGDDVLDRTAIANPQYGCQFTRTTRAGYAVSSRSMICGAGAAHPRPHGRGVSEEAAER